MMFREVLPAVKSVWRAFGAGALYSLAYLALLVGFVWWML
jgi:hypothetical protein